MVKGERDAPPTDVDLHFIPSSFASLRLCALRENSFVLTLAGY